MTIRDTLTWFARDAVIHLGTPRGLEQPNGGAWGVRDVCQGSVEFLLSYGHSEAVADIIRRVFAQQYHRRGDWPQWFMFSPFQQIRAHECHGRIDRRVRGMAPLARAVSLALGRFRDRIKRDLGAARAPAGA